MSSPAEMAGVTSTKLCLLYFFTCPRWKGHYTGGIKRLPAGQANSPANRWFLAIRPCFRDLVLPLATKQAWNEFGSTSHIYLPSLTWAVTIIPEAKSDFNSKSAERNCSNSFRNEDWNELKCHGLSKTGAWTAFAQVAKNGRSGLKSFSVQPGWFLEEHPQDYARAFQVE